MDAIGLIAGSGWASGLNLYLVTLVLGMSGRLGWSDVPEVLTRTDVLITAAVLFFIEFAADKIPYLDNIWDAIHTVVRPLGAAALGYVIAGESGSMVARRCTSPLAISLLNALVIIGPIATPVASR